MTTIHLYRHAVRKGPHEVHTAESIGQWLLDTYGPQAPAHGGLFVFAGEPSAETDVTGKVVALLRNDAPFYTVFETPGEIVSLGALLTNLLISTAISFVAGAIFAPDKPTLANRTQESPNNALQERENRVRVLERVEDIFGTVPAFPSLLMPSYRKYIENREVEYGLYCVGRGHYEITDVRDGDTPLTEILGSSAAVYAPFNTPNSGAPQLTIGEPIVDAVLSVRPSSAMDSGGIVLRAPNQIQLPTAETRYFFRTAGGTAPIGGDAAGDIIYQPEGTRRPNFAAVAEVGQSVTVSGANAVANGVAGTRTIIEVHPDYIVLGGASIYPPGVITDIFATVQVANGLTDWTDWITLPDAARTEVWLNVVAQGGIYKDDGAKQESTVSYEVQVERLAAGTLAPTGQVENLGGLVTGAAANVRAETLERVTSWVGPARVRSRRTTPYDYDFSGAVVDEITWTALYSVTPVTKPHFGNKTIIHTVTRATASAAANSRRQLNCIASRLLPTYSGGAFSAVLGPDGALQSGTLHATSRIVDILAAVTVDPKIGGRALDEIDMVQVSGVQAQLDAWHPEVGQFNYTFDSDSLSYEETLQAIANAAFCKAYRQNGKIRLALDRPQANAVAIFTHRNKRPESETVTRKFANDADYDGVELSYADPDTRSQETIRLPLDGSYTKLKRVEISGIRSFAQAWFRANREMQRLRYERLSIETVVTTDARAVLPNSRLLIVDNTRFKSWDGEVLEQDGFAIRLSTPVAFETGEPHSIVIKRRDGSPQSITATAGAGPDWVVMGQAPTEALVLEPTPEEGGRTEFSFASDSMRNAQAWLAGEIVPTDDPGYYTVRAVNYSAEYYAADAQAVPARDSVIN